LNQATVSPRKLQQAPANLWSYLDMVGVTGSIPVAPTINPREIPLCSIIAR